MHVSIIGAGNLAFNLAQAIESAGHNIEEVYSRNLESAQKLVNTLDSSTAQSHLNFSQSFAKIFIVAVSDDAIESIANEIVLPDDAIIAHTSGTVSISQLENAGTEDFGIFYPLQTFTKNTPLDFKDIPLIINGSTESAIENLLDLANSISLTVSQLSDRQRQQLHLAAVFANNFVNYTIGAAFDLLDSGGIDRRIIYPLIQETVRKSLSFDPKTIQTGPAKREDYNTIGKHIELLSEDERLLGVYKTITNNIISSNENGE